MGRWSGAEIMEDCLFKTFEMKQDEGWDAVQPAQAWLRGVQGLIPVCGWMLLASTFILINKKATFTKCCYDGFWHLQEASDGLSYMCRFRAVNIKFRSGFIFPCRRKATNTEVQLTYTLFLFAKRCSAVWVVTVSVLLPNLFTHFD